MPNGFSSRRSESATASSACFDAAYGREERQRAAPGDRAHEDDPALRAAQRGQEGLRHRDLPDEIDLELVAELVRRDELERRAESRSRRC